MELETDKYLGMFIDESRENLQKLNESLLLLEKNTEDLEILNDIFRVAHTLKGMSRTMGFNDIGDLTHHMENILEPLREGQVKADGKILDVLFKCLDKLEELISRVIDGNYEDKKNDISPLIKDLTVFFEQLHTTGGAKKQLLTVEFNEYELTIIDNAKEKNYTPYEISVKIADDCVLPSVRAYMVVKAVENFGEVIKSVPSVEELEAGNFEEEFLLYLLTKQSQDEVSKVISDICEIEKVFVKPLSFEQGGDSSGQDSAMVKESGAGENQAGFAQQSAGKVVPQTIRVSAERIERLMNSVGELVINRTSIAQLSNDLKIDDLSNAIGLMGNITSDIQEIVMKLRMVPIEQVFNRFPRLVRDISKTLNKDINLKITGKDTEIDRIVVEEIGDPLVHLIRNSLDHGLETPEERIKAGKNAKGVIELSALNEGDNILVKVSDDGRGIDPEKIKASAVRKGLITEEAARKLQEREALELIMLPGFSTAEVATDISGRGVGMDVVKSKVSNLGGNVTISSKPGVGTTIVISLPSTMAIVQSLLLKVGEEIYAAPLNYISEVIDIMPDQVKNVQNKEVIVLRGNTLPLIRLNRILEVPGYVEEPGKPLTVVIVKNQSRYTGVIVSELIGQQEVVIKPVNKKLCSMDYISGATTLGNGEVALILNINALT